VEREERTNGRREEEGSVALWEEKGRYFEGLKCWKRGPEVRRY
jgi:hypothetical protein